MRTVYIASACGTVIDATRLRPWETIANAAGACLVLVVLVFLGNRVTPLDCGAKSMTLGSFAVA
jgi:hypothetical protein